jgi:translation initiation factor IF-1
MASDDLVELEGVITEVFPAGTFQVTLDQNGAKVVAHLGGKMRQNRIRVVFGDRVRVAITPYDLTKGRIVYRHK